MKKLIVFLSILILFTSIFYSFQFKTFAQTAPSLSVNASKNIAPFDKKIRGLAFGNWDFSWGRKFPSQIPGLINASKELQPGMVRWAGGLWANYVGFDRTKNQIRPQTEWFSSAGKGPYYYNYGIDEMASVDSFAKQIGAEVMIQVNVSINEPDMWADMVRYAREKGFNFKYWEMGNELDLEKWEGKSNIDPDEYSRRVIAYTKAMKAVDPTIKIVGGVPASGTDVFLTGWETLQLSQSRIHI